MKKALAQMTLPELFDAIDEIVCRAVPIDDNEWTDEELLIFKEAMNEWEDYPVEHEDGPSPRDTLNLDMITWRVAEKLGLAGCFPVINADDAHSLLSTIAKKRSGMSLSDMSPFDSISQLFDRYGNMNFTSKDGSFSMQAKKISIRQGARVEHVIIKL